VLLSSPVSTSWGVAALVPELGFASVMFGDNPQHRFVQPAVRVSLGDGNQQQQSSKTEENKQSQQASNRAGKSLFENYAF